MATEESDTPPASTQPAVSEPGDAAMATAVVDSAPSAVEPSSGGVLSDSDDASSEWQLVAGKRKREGPLAPEPLVTRPLPPAEPKLGRLVIADDDPDPKILRQNSSGSESESSV